MPLLQPLVHPMKPSRKTLLLLAVGIVIGGIGANLLTSAGVNLRVFPWTTNGITVVAPDRGIHATSAERIFSQFAHQLRPPRSSSQVHSVLNATWLKKDMIHMINVLGGWIPVSGDGSPFCLTLGSKGEPRPAIYFLLSSADDEQDAYDFLTGKDRKGVLMTEFALCYPPCLERDGRYERFTWWGIQTH